ncbi:MAG: hypothetical protein M3270_04300 [Thermoproteota archaeon]|nr:hypothetical protein [Thermoproteota archaeon]
MISKTTEMFSIGLLAVLVAFLAMEAVAVFIAPVGVDYEAHALRIQDPNCRLSGNCPTGP